MRKGDFMKGYKKLISLVMSFVMLVTSAFSMNIGIAVAATSGTCGNNATWNYNTTTKTLTISGSGATKDYNAAISKAPWTSYKEEITTLVVGNGITEIGNYNFYNCTALTSVTLPNTLEVLHGMGTMTTSYGCFQGCTALQKITLPEGLTTIQNCAFKDCTALTSIKLPNSLTTLSYGAFAECHNLESVTFGSGLTETGTNAFYNAGVKRITWGDNITSISTYSFFGCKMQNIDIPEKITSIGLRALADCVNLTGVTINNASLNFTGDPCNGSEQSITIYGHKGSTAETYATDKNYKFVSLDACNHDTTHEVTAIEPTCTEAGLLQNVCDSCDAVVTESKIDALGHDYKAIETVDNTDVDGHVYREDKCSRCNDQKTVITHQRLENGDTNYVWIEGNYTYTNTATCTDTGYERYTCTVEGCNQTEYHIARSGNHEITVWTTTLAPTCTEAGSKQGICNLCGETVTETVPAKGHIYTEEDLIADLDTTDEDGHTHLIYDCQACHEQVDIATHVEWVEGFYTATVITPARCVIDGLEYDTCDLCSATRNVTLKANGQHDWYETSTTDPTCTAVGKIYYACHNCTLTKSENIDALGHDYVKVEENCVAPTCTEEGEDYYKCSRCPGTKKVPLEANGHSIDRDDFTILSVETCEEDGAILSVCTVCGTGFTEVVPALGHDFEDVYEDLTPENKPGHALVTPTCTRCGTTKAATMQHTEWIDGKFTTEDLTRPTCNLRGTMRDTCSICGTTRINYIPALGHFYNYTGNVDADGAQFRCSICFSSIKIDPSTILAQWDNSVVNTKVINRSTVDDSSFLDANGDGIINAKDYAILKKLNKQYIAAKELAEQEKEDNSSEETGEEEEPVDSIE